MGSADDGGGIPLSRRSRSDRLLPDSLPGLRRRNYPVTGRAIITAFRHPPPPRGDGSPGRHLTSLQDWKMDRIPMRK
ncbi:hypothetical protein TNIN_484621 [Trichonephila inaurata madagascariensis]|uniref:Uncharacterized protein n=1 Tax=Trichonephila inaurata madagascariensis TaxID=2747483 RepID=A0A8X6Y3L6_9ARAC|nr:hypothetical protein TNIN_484621 [Trichonephila inaurata madagascariensis]